MTIVLLSQADCHLCDRAHEVLQRLSQEYAVELMTVDLGSPAGEELAAQHQLAFPPGVIIDGEPFSYGRLSERRIRKELNRRATAR